jgi:hypothetical protein
MCVFWFSQQILSETFLILRRIQRGIVTNMHRLHVKHPLFLSDFNESWTFSTDVSKNIQILNFMKIHLVGAELFHGDRRKYTKKLRATFGNFANAPRNSSFLHKNR